MAHNVRTWGAAVLRPYNIQARLNEEQVSSYARNDNTVMLWTKRPSSFGGFTNSSDTALPVHQAFGEGVVAGADAHRVVPCDRERPPDQSA